MRIGARIIKTGIAVTITMFICKVLNLEPAFFGAVSAVVNMQPSIFLTVKTARDQILVHLLGVGAGLLFGYLLGGNPLVMGLVTILMISVYLKLNLQSGISMGIVAAVFVLGSSQEQFLSQALNRSAVIFAGLTTAMLVNILLWPPRYSDQFKIKLQEGSEEVALYFCRAIQEYVQIENTRPAADQKYREKVHKLNQEVRDLAALLKREVLSFGSLKQREWLVRAEKLLDYNETLTEKADRIYELVPQRFERRQAAGALPVSNEFKVILEILQSGCLSVKRLTDKLQRAIIEEQQIEAEEISEDYWEKLTKAIEEWQPKLAGSYYIHPLIEAAVMASEIKWAARQAKKLLQEVTAK